MLWEPKTSSETKTRPTATRKRLCLNSVKTSANECLLPSPNESWTKLVDHGWAWPWLGINHARFGANEKFWDDSLFVQGGC